MFFGLFGTCVDCRGTGIVTCRDKNCLSPKERSVPCPVCKGRRCNPDCQICKGSGRRACPDCAGTGSIDFETALSALNIFPNEFKWEVEDVCSGTSPFRVLTKEEVEICLRDDDYLPKMPLTRERRKLVGPFDSVNLHYRELGFGYIIHAVGREQYVLIRHSRYGQGDVGYDLDIIKKRQKEKEQAKRIRRNTKWRSYVSVYVFGSNVALTMGPSDCET
jgi:hypothetical protein